MMNTTNILSVILAASKQWVNTKVSKIIQNVEKLINICECMYAFDINHFLPAIGRYITPPMMIFGNTKYVNHFESKTYVVPNRRPKKVHKN